MEVMKYEIRAGTADQGKSYENNLTALLALRGILCSDVEDFWIMANPNDCGVFDDVVLHTTFKDGTENLYLIQIKHSNMPKVIPTKELFIDNNLRGYKRFYSLERYSESYKDIYANLSNMHPVLSQKLRELNSDCVKFVLFTSNHMEEGIYKSLQKVEEPFLETDDRCGYRFQLNNFLLSVIQPTISIDNNFLDQFLLFPGQVSNSAIPKLIINTFARSLKRMQIPEYFVSSFSEFIRNWSEGYFGGHYVLTKAHLINKVTELLIERFRCNSVFRQPFQPNCGQTYDFWHAVMRSKNFTVVTTAESDSTNFVGAVDFCCGYITSMLRENCPGLEERDWKTQLRKTHLHNLDGTLVEELWRNVGQNGLITMLQVYITLWKLGKLPLLLRANEPNDLEDIVSILKLSEFQLKVIVLCKTAPDSHILQGIPGLFADLSHLKKVEYEKVAEHDIKFQDRPTQLKELIDNSNNIKSFITVANIIEILDSSGCFNVGITYEPTPPYFVDRTIPKVLIDPEKLKIDPNGSDFFEIECKGHYLKLNEVIHSFNGLTITLPNSLNNTAILQVISNPKVKVVEAFAEAEHCENKNVHYLILNENEEMEWVRTVGSLDFLKSCILETERQSKDCSVSAADAIGYFKNAINVISAEPGLGKSTILNYMACRAPIYKYVLKIDLVNHADYYLRCEKREKGDPYSHLRYFVEELLTRQYKNNSLNYELFRDFLKSNAVMIMLDGMDEVSPCHKNAVTNIIKDLISTNNCMWIATRPILQSYVEEQFNAICLQLNSLEGSSQVSCLELYFKHALTTKEDHYDKLNGFASHLLDAIKSELSDSNSEKDFASIPLHIKIIADIFQEDCIRCVVGEETTRIENGFNLLDLYESFVSAKVEILHGKLSNGYLLNMYESYQEYFALQIVFSKYNLDNLKISERISIIKEDICDFEELVQKNGILLAIDGSPSGFIHASFADYFAAKWLAKNCRNPKAQPLIRILFKKEHDFVRKLFDLILAKGCPLHVLIINRQFQKAHELIALDPNLLRQKDAGERLPCHLAGSWGRRSHFRVNVLKSASRDDMVEVFKKCMRVHERLHEDAVLKLNPLEYAIFTDSLANVDALLGISSINIGLNDEKYTGMRLLYNVIRQAFKEVHRLKITKTTPPPKSNSVYFRIVSIVLQLVQIEGVSSSHIERLENIYISDIWVNFPSDEDEEGISWPSVPSSSSSTIRKYAPLAKSKMQPFFTRNRPLVKSKLGTSEKRSKTPDWFYYSE